MVCKSRIGECQWWRDAYKTLLTWRRARISFTAIKLTMTRITSAGNAWMHLGLREAKGIVRESRGVSKRVTVKGYVQVYADGRIGSGGDDGQKASLSAKLKRPQATS